MKFGLRLPGAGPYAGPEAITAFAQKAEHLGFDSIWMTDHIALPVDVASKYPYTADGKFFWPPETPYFDTILTLTWASAATSSRRATAFCSVDMKVGFVSATAFSTDLTSEAAVTIGCDTTALLTSTTGRSRARSIGGRRSWRPPGGYHSPSQLAPARQEPGRGSP